MKTKGLKILLFAMLGIFVSNYTNAQGTPDVPEECLKNYSLYYEFYKHKNFQDALDPWRKLFVQCPEWKESTFAYGVNIYRYFLEKEQDPAKKAAYADSMMMVYDLRIKYFPKKEGDILGRKGIDLLRYRRLDGIEFIKEGYDILKKSVEIEGNKSSPVVLTTMISAGISVYIGDLIEGEDLINSYVTATNILDAQIARRPTAKTTRAKNAIDSNIKESKVLTCEAITNIYASKFEENKNDLDFLKLVSGFMNDAGECEMDPLYAQVNERLYELEPSAEAAYSLGRLFLKKNEFTKSKTYFLEAIDLTENEEDKANYYYSLAGLSQQYLDSPVDAARYASEAVSLRPDWGEPYLLMGMSYIAGNSSLGDEFERRTAYWVAVDMFYKAKSVDPSVSNRATDYISEYSEYFPTKEDLFFRSIAEGDKYTVGGWINRTTTARPKN